MLSRSQVIALAVVSVLILALVAILILYPFQSVFAIILLAKYNG